MRTIIASWTWWMSIPLMLVLIAPLHLCENTGTLSNVSAAYSLTADKLTTSSDSAYIEAIDESTLWELVREPQMEMQMAHLDSPQTGLPIIANEVVENQVVADEALVVVAAQKTNESNKNNPDALEIPDADNTSQMNEKTRAQMEIENLIHFGYSQASCQNMAKIKTCSETENTRGFLWYYDQIEKQCLSTSDCISNENRFESEADCKSTCLPKSPLRRCLAPPKAGYAQCAYSDNQTGPSAAIQKAYFDKALESCSWFVYLGCGGSDNQFASIEECTDTCMTTNAIGTIRQSAQKICELPHMLSDSAKCEDVGQASSRWYYDPKSQLCKEFGYSHCSGTANIFLSKLSCELFCGAKTLTQEAICKLPPEAGDCKPQQAHEMWYYDSVSGDCRMFAYSGCGGNDNRFSSHSACQQACRILAQTLLPEVKSDTSQLGKILEPDANTSSPDILLKEEGVEEDKTLVETNLLREPLKMFQPLVYNLTTFTPQSVDIEPCSERPEPGQCAPIDCPNATDYQTKLLVRWFFNPRTSNCENFGYSGCGGSANTFDSAQSCSIACKQRIMRPERDKRCNNNPKSDGCYSLPLPQNKERATETTEVFFYFSIASGTCRAFHLMTDNDRCERQAYFTDGHECLKACVKSSPTERDLPNRCFARKLNSGTTKCPIERHNVSRWSYLPDLQQCVLFIQCHKPDAPITSAWGNNFESEELCIATCNPKSLKDVCRLPKDTGPCQGSNARYYYDPTAGKCRLFVYGGCLGNGNRFNTKTECEDVCGELRQMYDTEANSIKPSDSTSTHVVKFQPVPDEVVEEMRRIKIMYSERYPWDFCLQHHTYGTCPRPRGLHDRNAGHGVHLTRYFYNPKTQRCESYFYTGCGARGNHFETKLHCDSICTRRLRQSASPRCDASQVQECQNSELRLWIYEAEAGTCRQVEVCSIPRTTSSSLSDPFRWQMGVANGVFRLRPSIGGSPSSVASGINSHLLPGTFTSSSACHNHCLPPTPSGTDVTNICHMNPITSVSNECRMMVNRWYFDVKDGYCRSYISCPVYGNNFADENACNFACRPKHISDVCKLPLDYGGCSRYLQRWYYNTEKRTCEPFSYGGCFGNSNRFLTKQECDSACTQTDICSLPKPKEAEGNEPSTLRYFFNQTTGVCEKFFFSGKIPQGNNFADETICHSVCISAPNLLPISVKMNKMAFSMDQLATKFGHVVRHSTLSRGHKATCLSSPQLLNIVKNETIQNCHPGGTVAELAYAYDVATNSCFTTMIYVCLDYPNEPYRIKILGRKLIFESQGHCESECLQSER